jgi:hypothetical protein
MKGPAGTCLGYNVPGAGSFNIAKCTPNPGDAVCTCLFFATTDCTGNSDGVATPGGGPKANCANTARTRGEPRSVVCYSIAA